MGSQEGIRTQKARQTATKPRILQKDADTRKVGATRKVDSTSKTEGADESSLLVKSMAIREDQYNNILSLAAYNKLRREKPDTFSGIVRKALDDYILKADVSLESLFQKLE